MRLFFQTLMIVAIGVTVTAPLEACNYSAMMRSFNRALERYQANPTQARADRICRIRQRIHDKWGSVPPFIVPPPPAGVMCAVMPGRGAGRGGGPGGVIIGIGNGGTAHGWVRNPTDTACVYDWEIIPDPGNPAGITVFPLSGSVTVPGHSSVPVPIDVEITPLTLAGEVGLFDIFWTDTCAGFPLPDDGSRFQVFADPEISLLPADPFLLAAPGVPLPVMFEIVNHTGAPVMRTFDFVHHGDPASEMELNNGAVYDAQNLFPIDKSVSSVSVTVPAFDSEIILKETLIAGEICDPAMYNCCGLSLGAAFCCAQILNDDLGPQRVTPLFQELVGQPTGAGDIGFQVNGLLVQIPTNLAPTAGELLDVLTLQTLDASLFIDPFNYAPLVDESGFMLMTPLPLVPNFFSTDPGLQWLPSPPPILPLLPDWPGLELMTQALVPQVNAWAPPPP